MKIDPGNAAEQVLSDPVIDADGFVCLREDVDIGQFGGQLDFGLSGSITVVACYSLPGMEYVFEVGLISLSADVVEDPVIDADGFVYMREDIDIGQFGGQLDFGFSGSITGVFPVTDYPARDYRYPTQAHHAMTAVMLQ